MHVRAVIPLLLLMFLAALPPVATAQPAFYESILVVDEPEDFAQGALDIAGLYAKEVYPYDSIENKGRDLVVIRLQPRNLGDANQCLLYAATLSQQVCSIRYDVHFEVLGKAHHLFMQFGPQGTSPRCCPVEQTNANVSFNATSVLFLLDRADMGLAPGLEITKLYATSAVVRGDQTQKGDRAPGDNQNLPYDQRPEIADQFAAPYRLRGTFEFFTVDVVDGLVRNSVGGQQVKFSFRIAPNAAIDDDTIRVRFDRPEGWSVTPSRGETGANPTGLVTGIDAGMVVPFEFTASANNIVNEGDLAPFGVHFHSSSEGHVLLIATVRVTGNTIEDPNYAFQLHDSGPFRTGSTATIRFQVLDATGRPLVGLPIDASFIKEGRRVASVPAAPKDSAYEATYAFPSEGTWTIDLALRGLSPAPHAAFTVDVRGGGGAPGPGLPVLLGLVAAAAFFVRRWT